jgi:YD repeat-containing protein
MNQAKMGDTSSAPDENDLITQYTRDSVGNILKIKYPAVDTISFTYNANNKPISRTNGESERRQLEYDDMGKLATVFRKPPVTYIFSL